MLQPSERDIFRGYVLKVCTVKLAQTSCVLNQKSWGKKKANFAFVFSGWKLWITQEIEPEILELMTKLSKVIAASFKSCVWSYSHGSQYSRSVVVRHSALWTLKLEMRECGWRRPVLAPASGNWAPRPVPLPSPRLAGLWFPGPAQGSMTCPSQQRLKQLLSPFDVNFRERYGISKHSCLWGQIGWRRSGCPGFCDWFSWELVMVKARGCCTCPCWWDCQARSCFLRSRFHHSMGAVWIPCEGLFKYSGEKGN